MLCPFLFCRVAMAEEQKQLQSKPWKTWQWVLAWLAFAVMMSITFGLVGLMVYFQVEHAQTNQKTQEMLAAMGEKNLVLSGDDGSSYECEIVDTITCFNKLYAVLRKIAETKTDPKQPESKGQSTRGSGQSELVIMRLSLRDKELIFSVIDDEAEFERVTNYFQRTQETQQRLQNLKQPLKQPLEYFENAGKKLFPALK